MELSEFNKEKPEKNLLERPDGYGASNGRGKRVVLRRGGLQRIEVQENGLQGVDWTDGIMSGILSYFKKAKFDTYLCCELDFPQNNEWLHLIVLTCCVSEKLHFL